MHRLEGFVFNFYFIRAWTELLRHLSAITSNSACCFSTFSYFSQANSSWDNILAHNDSRFVCTWGFIGDNKLFRMWYNLRRNMVSIVCINVTSAPSRAAGTMHVSHIGLMCDSDNPKYHQNTDCYSAAGFLLCSFGKRTSFCLLVDLLVLLEAERLNSSVKATGVRRHDTSLNLDQWDLHTSKITFDHN